MSAPSIVGIGCAVPRYVLRQEAIAGRMIAAHGFSGHDARRLAELYRLTRIDERHSVIADFGGDALGSGIFPGGGGPADAAASTARRMEVFAREALPLAVSAARPLLSGGDAAMPAGDIDHLLVVSCTGATAPGLDGLLVDALGLRDDVGRTLISFQGCHAGLAARRVAAALATARPASAVLVVCVELSTLHFQLDRSDENRVANALFADGAAAALVAGAERVARMAAGTLTPRFEIGDMRTVLRSRDRDAMVWTIGDTGFRLHLSSLLPRLIAADVRPAIAPLLAGRTPESAGFWAVHPGGSAILQAVERALELPASALAASRDVLRRFGNMSSPTIFFVLRDLLTETPAGADGIALAFGPGLTIEAARLRRQGAC